MGWDDVSRANSIAILCAARSATAQPADGILNSVIRLAVGAVLRASVRLNRSQLTSKLIRSIRPKRAVVLALGRAIAPAARRRSSV
jgi:hypothetical protein